MRILRLKKSDIENVIERSKGLSQEEVGEDEVTSITDFSADDLMELRLKNERLTSHLKLLTQKKLNELFVVMCYGRDDEDLKDFWDILEEEDNENDLHLAEYFVEKSFLASYLEDGLKNLSTYYK